MWRKEQVALTVTDVSDDGRRQARFLEIFLGFVDEVRQSRYRHAEDP